MLTGGQAVQLECAFDLRDGAIRRSLDRRTFGANAEYRDGADAMMVHIPNVLTPEQVARCRDVMTKADWVDGRVTAGISRARSSTTCNCPRIRRRRASSATWCCSALARNPLFMSAVLPQAGVPAAVQPLRRRHDVRLACRQCDPRASGTPVRIRTDVSSTLFISAPEDYDGGELVVEDTYGSHAVKLPAGDMIVYPAHQPASRHADHARLAHRLVLLDPEPDPRRDQARAAVRSRHVDHPAHADHPEHPSLVD